MVVGKDKTFQVLVLRGRAGALGIHGMDFLLGFEMCKGIVWALEGLNGIHSVAGEWFGVPVSMEGTYLLLIAEVDQVLSPDTRAF